MRSLLKQYTNENVSKKFSGMLNLEILVFCKVGPAIHLTTLFFSLNLVHAKPVKYMAN